MERSEQGETRIVVAAAIAFALLLRAPYFSLPLGIDEGGVAYVADAWGRDGDSLYGPYWLDRPPLLLVLFKLAELGGPAGVRALGAVAAGCLIVATAWLARLLAGHRAARIAAVLAAVLTGSVTIHAVYTPAELLAVVPATASVLCLLLALLQRDGRWLLLAGAGATCAALIKQSFLDPGIAGVAFLVAAAVWRRESGFRARWVLAWAAGAAAPLILVLAWASLAEVSIGDLTYALVGFRIDALGALRDAESGERLRSLGMLALTSGLALVALFAVAGLWRQRSQPIVAVTLTAWLAAGLVGVLGGGSYWSHYLIQPAPVCIAAAAVALAALGRTLRTVAVGVAVAFGAASAVAAVVYLEHRATRASEVSVARFVRVNARPGDTLYVMYARANVLYYAGLRNPFPYAWSLMVRAKPEVRQELHGLLASPRRPTWLVLWNDEDTWNLDRHHIVDRILRRRYRRVAIVCGRFVFLRADHARRPLVRLRDPVACSSDRPRPEAPGVALRERWPSGPGPGRVFVQRAKPASR